MVNSGAIVLGPFKADDVSIYHDTNLPAAQWLPEMENFTLVDIQFAATVMRPRRIAAQVVVSRHLLIQATGAVLLDEFIASRFAPGFLEPAKTRPRNMAAEPLRMTR